MTHDRRSVICALLGTLCALRGVAYSAASDARSERATQRSLAVMILPVDGGTQDATLADYRPTLDAIAATTGMTFDVRVGQSYSAVVEALATGLIDMAQLGVVSYQQARARGGARFLAMQVIEGSGVYFGALFVRSSSGIRGIEALRGRSVAFGDPGSASSFAYPVAMLLRSGIEPGRDLARVVMAGSHANALRALAEGRVDAAAASLISFQRAVDGGLISAADIRPIARSVPIPNPLFATRADLPPQTFARLRKAFATVHAARGADRIELRGYGGQIVTRWDTEVPTSVLDEAAEALQGVTPAVIGAMLSKAGSRR